MLVDTHTHLYLPEFDADRTEAIDRALNAGVGHMILPNVDCSTVGPMRSLHNAYPDITSMAMGLHPTEIKETWENDLNQIIDELDRDHYVAIGEIGIDLYWDKTYERQQMEAFHRQIDIAKTKSLPLIIHCRDGLDRAIEVLESFKGQVSGVFHSFGGTPEDVERIRRVGDFYFGINGIVTFKNSRLRETLPTIGVNRILLETDSPYLAPVPHRGKRNETSYLVNTARIVGEVFGRSEKEIAAETTQNAKKLFRFME